MKALKNIFIIFQIYILLIIISTSLINTEVKAEFANEANQPVKIAVLFYDYGDNFILLLKNEFEKIQKENPSNIKFEYYDGKNDQSIQNLTLEKILIDKSADLIMLNMVDPQVTKEALDKIKEYNIPVVLFNREPVKMNDVKSYNKAYYVGTDEKLSSSIEANIIIDLWENNKDVMDRNTDNKLQYVMLRGEPFNQGAVIRTKYSILTINSAGINTSEVAVLVCNWKRDIAEAKFSSILLKNINAIEAVIANNDEMAIGAIQALQKYGYNLGGNSKTIPVVGIDAIPDAQELIKKGEMAGTVVYPISEVANACFLIGINLINKKPPLYNTEYKFDESGVAVRLPYKKFTY